MNSQKLEIELVPRTSWYDNLRAQLPRETWDVLRRASYRQAGNRCEICGGKGTKHPVECHEIWRYDDKNRVQKLEGLISLCPDCHMCKHIGFASKIGKLPRCLKHLMAVNNMTHGEAVEMIDDAFEIWHARSQHDWDVDISIVDELIKKAKAL